MPDCSTALIDVLAMSATNRLFEFALYVGLKFIVGLSRRGSDPSVCAPESGGAPHEEGCNADFDFVPSRIRGFADGRRFGTVIRTYQERTLADSGRLG